MTMSDPRNWMWTDALTMIERAERLHRQFFQPGLPAVQPANWEPPVDILETEREILIIVALPGVEPEDLDVSSNGDMLVVAGVRRLPAVVRGASIRRLEIPHGRFERRIRLPSARFVLGTPKLANGCLFASVTKRP
jgi:HSP20 family molecular chaperone IbpA